VAVTRLLLDTNAYSALKRGDEAVASLVRAAEEIVFSAVVAGELLYGFRHGSRTSANIAELDEFLSRPHVTFVPASRVTADRFARIATALRKRGTPIPTNDIWIAAHAAETGADLVSFDDHFRHVDSVAWVVPGGDA
jgi:tRNA(fMet)-specific endonuclease VapC